MFRAGISVQTCNRTNEAFSVSWESVLPACKRSGTNCRWSNNNDSGINATRRDEPRFAPTDKFLYNLIYSPRPSQQLICTESKNMARLARGKKNPPRLHLQTMAGTGERPWRLLNPRCHASCFAGGIASHRAPATLHASQAPCHSAAGLAFRTRVRGEAGIYFRLGPGVLHRSCKVSGLSRDHAFHIPWEAFPLLHLFLIWKENRQVRFCKVPKRKRPKQHRHCDATAVGRRIFF